MQDKQNEQEVEDARQSRDFEIKMQRIEQEKKRRALAAELKKNAWKHSMAKTIANSDVILSYVTDKFGFRKGVVLAIGAGQLGWSLVSKEDYRTSFVGIEQLPWLAAYIQHPNRYRKGEKKMSAKEAISAFVRDPAFKAWAASGGVINVPQFSRVRGIEDAFNRARLYLETMPGQGLSFQDVPLPDDKDLLKAIELVNMRSHYHYRNDPQAFKMESTLK